MLTHAHLNHSGALPLIVKNGYRGHVYATKSAHELCELLLPDGGRIQEEDAAYATEVIRAMSLSMLILGNVSIILSSRAQGLRGSNRPGEGNVAMWVVMLGAVAALALILNWPALSVLFRVAMPDSLLSAWCVALFLAVTLAMASTCSPFALRYRKPGHGLHS